MVGQGKPKSSVHNHVPATIQYSNELLKIEKILINHSNHVWR